jgi:hypothetical protein
MKYIVRFNTAGAIAKMPARRRDWESQLVDDFIRAVNGKQFVCANREKLIERLDFISGSSSSIESPEENYLHFESDRYGKQIVPMRMYGFAQGYVCIERVLAPLDHGKVLALIPFGNFYDIRQHGSRRFKGCYVEIIPTGEEVPA